jgi:hypothetical protein
MAEAITHSTSQVTDSDLAAIATYLKSLPGRQENHASMAANDPLMVAGEAIYRDQRNRPQAGLRLEPLVQ